MQTALGIVVVVPDPALLEQDDEAGQAQADRSRHLRIGLLQGGFNLVASLPADAFLADRLAQLQPDVVIVDAESDARDALEHVVMATRDAPRPIVMFTNDDDPAAVQAAVAAGVSAYVVAGMASERIRPILDVALARFAHEQALRRELQQVRSDLNTQTRELEATLVELRERKTIERAKGLLMQRQNLNEQQAYAKLRKTAMDRGLRLADVAQKMIDAAQWLA